MVTSSTRTNLVAALLVWLAMPASAAEFSGYLTLTTDYVWRGVTQSSGNPAAQLGGEASFRSGLYAGMWASTIDIDGGGGRRRDAELNYYVGFSHDVSRRWRVGLHAVVYTYPGQTGSFDYDYEEYGFSVNYDDRVWLEYAHSPGYWGFDIDSHNIELISEWPAGKYLVLGAAIGYFDFGGFLDDSYVYWDVGVTRPFNRLAIDLRFHDTSGPVPIVSAPDRADARVVLSLRLTF